MKRDVTITITALNPLIKHTHLPFNKLQDTTYSIEKVFSSVYNQCELNIDEILTDYCVIEFPFTLANKNGSCKNNKLIFDVILK